MMIESMRMMTEVMKDNRDHFQTQLHAFDSTEELMRKQTDTLREVTAGMEAIVKGCGQINLTVNENTERMKALLTKVESYFGDSAGLNLRIDVCQKPDRQGGHLDQRCHLLKRGLLTRGGSPR